MAGAQLSACINHCTHQYADADHPQTYPCQSCGSSQKRTVLHSAHLYMPHFFGLLGVEMCQAWADACSFTMAIPIAWSAFRDMNRLKKTGEIPVK